MQNGASGVRQVCVDEEDVQDADHRMESLHTSLLIFTGTCLDDVHIAETVVRALSVQQRDVACRRRRVVERVAWSCRTKKDSMFAHLSEGRGAVVNVQM